MDGKSSLAQYAGTDIAVGFIVIDIDNNGVRQKELLEQGTVRAPLRL
jgi:hypothetical protein